MLFEIDRASLYTYEKPCDEAKKDGDKWIVEINTIEQLLYLINKYKHNLIISMDKILIYDDYVE